MIYASLKPIRQWHNRFVVPNYLLIALYAGALWLAGVTAFWQGAAARLPGAAAILFGVIALVMKLLYWRSIDATPSASTIESATGLGASRQGAHARGAAYGGELPSARDGLPDRPQACAQRCA